MRQPEDPAGKQSQQSRYSWGWDSFIQIQVCFPERHFLRREEQKRLGGYNVACTAFDIKKHAELGACRLCLVMSSIAVLGIG